MTGHVRAVLTLMRAIGPVTMMTAIITPVNANVMHDDEYTALDEWMAYHIWLPFADRFPRAWGVVKWIAGRLLGEEL